MADVKDVELAKAYFRQIENLEGRYQICIEKLAVEKTTSRKLIATYEMMPRGSSKSDISDHIVKMEQLQDECLMHYRQLMDKIEEICRFVENLDVDPISRRILVLRYISRYRWEYIAKELHYADVRQVHRKHGKALQAAQKKLEQSL